jgi:hypothetical protein
METGRVTSSSWPRVLRQEPPLPRIVVACPQVDEPGLGVQLLAGVAQPVLHAARRPFRSERVVLGASNHRAGVVGDEPDTAQAVLMGVGGVVVGVDAPDQARAPQVVVAVAEQRADTARVLGEVGRDTRDRLADPQSIAVVAVARPPSHTRQPVEAVVAVGRRDPALGPAGQVAMVVVAVGHGPGVRGGQAVPGVEGVGGRDAVDRDAGAIAGRVVAVLDHVAVGVAGLRQPVDGVVGPARRAAVVGHAGAQTGRVERLADGFQRGQTVRVRGSEHQAALSAFDWTGRPTSLVALASAEEAVQVSVETCVQLREALHDCWRKAEHRPFGIVHVHHTHHESVMPRS